MKRLPGFAAVGYLVAKFKHADVVFGRKIRALNIKAVADFVKFIDNLIEIFNQIQHIGAKVGNQVLFVKPAFNVTAGDVGVVFYLFDLFVELFVFVAALFGQINADGFLKVMAASMILSWKRSILLSSDLVCENSDSLT